LWRHISPAVTLNLHHQVVAPRLRLSLQFTVLEVVAAAAAFGRLPAQESVENGSAEKRSADDVAYYVNVVADRAVR